MGQISVIISRNPGSALSANQQARMSSAVLIPANDYKFPPEPVPAKLDRSGWDGVMGSIGLRLRILEAVSTGIARIQAELQQFGLQRLDEAILPLIEETRAQLLALQAQVAATIEENGAIIDDFQQQIDTAIATLTASISALQAQVDTILAGGIPAANVAEDGSRVFLTPAQRAEIATLRADLTTAHAAISAVSYSAVRPLVWTAGNVSVGAGQRVWFNTASAAGQATLPASPITGDAVDIARIGTNIVTINRNAKTIGGLADNLIIDRDKTGATLTYVNGGWRVGAWSIA